MIGSAMVTWFDRRTDATWTPPEALGFLNQGCLKVGQFVSSIDPDFFMRIRQQNLVAHVPYYPRPVDSKHVDSVWIAGDTADTDRLGNLVYRPIERKQRAFVLNRRRANGVSAGGLTVWARFGRFVQIDPAPSDSVTLGLQVLEAYLPTITDLDQEVPLPIDLHGAVVNRAHRICLPETPDFAALADSLDKEYEMMTGDWAKGFFETAEPVQMEVDDPGYDAEG